jgi:DNA-binding beta-propeller fold protein YncE
MHPLERIELDEGTIQPVNFFVSGDASQIYVVTASSSSILVYNFISGAVIGGIELMGNALPVSADMTVDAGTIVVAGTDGMVHEVGTALGGADTMQVSFPNLPDYLNPFCTFTPSAGPCTLTTVLVKP